MTTESDLIAPVPLTSSKTHEAAHFAHAAARVIESFGPGDAARSGDGLLDLISRHCPVSAVRKVRTAERPSRAELRAIAAQLLRKRKAMTQLDHIVGWIADLFGLDDTERAVIGAVARWSLFDHWRQLTRQLPERCSHPTATAIAALSGQPQPTVEDRLAAGSRLFSSRLMSDDGDGEYNIGRLLQRITRMTITSREDMLARLLTESGEGTLEWADFDHLGDLRDLTERVLAGNEPVSVLLYGEPGTGKTEFAHALARRLGLRAVFAGLADEQGKEPDRDERLGHLMFLRQICHTHSDKLLVLDEADDVLTMTERNGASKQWLNRLVELPQVSTLWIVNRQSDLDPALLRRMTLAIGFDLPPTNIRERIAARAAATTGIALDEAAIRTIGGLRTSAAVVNAGMKAARLSDGGANAAMTTIRSVMKAMGQPLRPEQVASGLYDASLASADRDLEDLAERLARTPDRRWSLLLSGPSGTGKSAFARHLAERMGVAIEERRCSDLISPYVGETERAIAAAFETAAERGAMLLIDEADSFLHRRDASQRSWEITKVNEMLVQMEHLAAPFVATTNHCDMLDSAMQRRFALRVRFETLAPAQVRHLFRRYFEQNWPEYLSVPDALAPGDFAVVARRASLIGETDSLVLARWLDEEIIARGGRAGQAIGFHLPKSQVVRQRMPANTFVLKG